MVTVLNRLALFSWLSFLQAPLRRANRAPELFAASTWNHCRQRLSYACECYAICHAVKLSLRFIPAASNQDSVLHVSLRWHGKMTREDVAACYRRFLMFQTGRQQGKPGRQICSYNDCLQGLLSARAVTLYSGYHLWTISVLA